MQLLGKIPFIKPQNDTDKRSKTMKNASSHSVSDFFPNLSKAKQMTANKTKPNIAQEKTKIKQRNKIE